MKTNFTPAESLNGDTLNSKVLSEAKAFCVSILPAVSRTFAINIGYLRGPLHEAVLTGYLFCRMIDTLEDTAVLSIEEKKTSLLLWKELFPFSNQKDLLLESLQKLLLKGNLTSNAAENALLHQHTHVFTLFQNLPDAYQTAMIPSIRTMAGGMAKFQTWSQKTEGNAWIETVEQLEEYCYYVAGTVGEMLVNLFLLELRSLPEDQKKTLRENAVSFGLGLQMTNILKDIRDDFKRDWCFIPKKMMEAAGLRPENLLEAKNKMATGKILGLLAEITATHLEKAFRYCIALPRFPSTYRIFCLLPLHFAMQTLSELKQQTLSSQKERKISRAQIQKTVLFTRLFSASNLIQQFYFRHYQKKIS